MKPIIFLWLLFIFILSTEVFIYPGILLAKTGVPAWGYLFFCCLLALILRFIFKKKPSARFYRSNFLIFSPILILVTFILVLSDKLFYPNFAFSHFHLHPGSLYLMVGASLFFSIIYYEKKFIKNPNLWVFVAPVYFYPLLLIRFYNPGLHAWLKGENSFLEQMEFLMLLVLSFYSLKISQSNSLKSLNKIYPWLFKIATLGFFFIAMEEISWGQKLFEVPVPENIAQYNTQKELNIHNNKAVFPIVYYFYLILSAYALFGYWLKKLAIRLIRKLKSFWLWLFIIPPYLTTYFLPSFFYVIIRQNRESQFYQYYFQEKLFETFDIIHEYEEYTEFLLILGLLIFINSLYQKFTSHNKKGRTFV